MKTKKLYITGPMTGIPENNFPLFHKVAKGLREMGYETVNPAELLPSGLSVEWEDFMREDITHLMKCDGVVLLPGWSRSRGAKIEVQLAMDLNMLIVSVDFFFPKGL